MYDTAKVLANSAKVRQIRREIRMRMRRERCTEAQAEQIVLNEMFGADRETAMEYRAALDLRHGRPVRQRFFQDGETLSLEELTEACRAIFRSLTKKEPEMPKSLRIIISVRSTLRKFRWDEEEFDREELDSILQNALWETAATR